MSESKPTRTQISFVAKNKVMAVDFMATSAERDALEQKLTPILDRQINDYQLYEVTSSPGSAAGLVSDIRDALMPMGDEDSKHALQKAMDFAARIDSELDGVDVEECVVDFVWNNGGPDNAFTQSFNIPRGQTERSQEFSDILAEAFEESGHVYDLRITHAESVKIQPSFEQAMPRLLRLLSEAQHEDLADDVALAFLDDTKKNSLSEPYQRQISFVLSKKPINVDFLATDEELEPFDGKLSRILRGKLDNFYIYTLSEPPTSAEAVVSSIASSVRHTSDNKNPDTAIKEALDYARLIDSAANGVDTEEHLVDFVWNNSGPGGASTHGFLLPRGSTEMSQKFSGLLEEAFAKPGYICSLSLKSADDVEVLGSPDLALSRLLQVLNEAHRSDLANRVASAFPTLNKKPVLVAAPVVARPAAPAP